MQFTLHKSNALIVARVGEKETVCLSINTDNSNPSTICPSFRFTVIPNELTVKKRMALKISSLQLRYTSWLKKEQHFILKHSNWKKTRTPPLFHIRKTFRAFWGWWSHHGFIKICNHILKFQAHKQLKGTSFGVFPPPSNSQTLDTELSLQLKVWSNVCSWKPKREGCARISLLCS